MSIVIVVFNRGDALTTMRRMIAQLNQASINQFRCSDCDWVFHVQQPVTPEVSVEVQQSYAQRWFAAHSCAAGTGGTTSIRSSNFTTVSTTHWSQNLAHSGRT
ncbi:MAG TPA: hypothetical protein VK763_02345 [Terriglobales bacterium]|nr:hypothetical protein [Terriglobales bacterium]